MKVLMTADTIGGVWTYALDLIRALPDVEFVLASMGRRIECEVPPNAKWIASDWLIDLEASERPDLIHLNGYAHGALPFRAPKLIVAHSCVCRGGAR